MDTNKTLGQARTAATEAKDGTLKTPEGTFRFTFDRKRWVYVVTLEGQAYPNFTDLNTKSLKQARQWLRNYLAN